VLLTHTSSAALKDVRALTKDTQSGSCSTDECLSVERVQVLVCLQVRQEELVGLVRRLFVAVCPKLA